MKIACVMMINAGLSRCLVLAATAALLAGCGGGGPEPRARTGKAAGLARSASPSPPSVSRASGTPPPGSGREDGPHPPPDGYRRWGLDRPLDPPPPPAAKPAFAPVWPPLPGLATVIRQVATTDRVVFLTLDDGIEKDPAFIDQARDLGLPFTQFLEDEVIGDHYDYFRALRELGNRIGNHTLTHPSLAGKDYETQLHEICGQQEVLRERLGLDPRLFRPPYGDYDRNTLRAAAECGLNKAVLWRAEMEPEGLVYRSGDRLRPGDIILAHFQGCDQAARGPHRGPGERG
jgi:peptidoglycan/xylan/chitin deacetylase (PgdA/CDA1 family)